MKTSGIIFPSALALAVVIAFGLTFPTDAIASKKELVKRVLGRFATNPGVVKPFVSRVTSLSDPIQRIGIQSMLPRSKQEFQEVFGKTAFDSQIEKFNSLGQNIRSLSGFGAETFEIRTLSDLRRAIQNPHTSHNIIVGHSINRGSKLILPSGEQIAVTELQSICQRAGKICIAVTCQSRDLAIMYDIAADSAVSAVSSAVKRFRHHRGADMQVARNTYLRKPHQNGINRLRSDRDVNFNERSRLTAYDIISATSINSRDMAIRSINSDFSKTINNTERIAENMSGSVFSGQDLTLEIKRVLELTRPKGLFITADGETVKFIIAAGAVGGGAWIAADKE